MSDLARYTVMGEEAAQQGAGCSAVDIVVAEDRDALALADGLCKARCGIVHVGQHGRVGHQVADGRLQEPFGVFRFHAAPGQHPGDELGNVARLRDRQRRVAGARVEAVAPLLPEGGFTHGKERLVGFERVQWASGSGSKSMPDHTG